MTDIARVEDIYPTTPAQAGILFESGSSAAPGTYVTQMSGVFHGLDRAAFERAWRGLIARHTILRTAFVWDRVPAPVQVVGASAAMAWQEGDWSAGEAAVRVAHLRAYLEADRAAGFAFSRAPMMRVALFALGGDAHQFIWTHHHIALDGWSIFLLLSDLQRLYAAERGGGADLPPPLPFRRYVEWLQVRDLGAAEALWSQEFAGYRPSHPSWAPDAQPAAGAACDAERHAEHLLERSPEETERLRAAAAAAAVTVNTIVQAAWVLALRSRFAADEFVLGVTCSGRPVDLDGADRIAGMLVNVLPFRVRLERDLPAVEWLRRQQLRQADMRAFEYVQQSQIARWAALPAGRRLFDTIFTWQNYPVESGFTRGPLWSHASDVQHYVQNHYPLTLIASARSRLTLRARRDPRRIGAEVVEDLFRRFDRILNALVAAPHLPIGTLLEQIDADAARERAGARRQALAADLGRLKAARPAPVRISAHSLVRTTPMIEGAVVPLLVEPGVADLDPIAWAQGHRAEIEALLAQHGALLFRGFPFPSVRDFEAFAAAAFTTLFEDYGDLPRTSLGGRVYASTPYPASEPIHFHNEGAHTPRWPTRIAFHCVIPAQHGGETPLADGRAVYERLSVPLRRRFEALGLLYVRNFVPALDVSWQQMFGTDDRALVERQCAADGVECVWVKGQQLRTRRRTVAVVQHPATSEPVLFNQIQLHHPFFLPRSTFDTLGSLFQPDEFPRNVFFGDGTPLDEDVLIEIRDAYRQSTSMFPWQRGDVLVVDNLRVAHGRSPFEGERKIVVALADAVAAGRFEAGLHAGEPQSGAIR